MNHNYNNEIKDLLKMKVDALVIQLADTVDQYNSTSSLGEVIKVLIDKMNNPLILSDINDALDTKFRE